MRSESSSAQPCAFGQHVQAGCRTDRFQLAAVTDQNQLGAGSIAVACQFMQSAQIRETGFVADDHVVGAHFFAVLGVVVFQTISSEWIVQDLMPAEFCNSAAAAPDGARPITRLPSAS